MTERRGLFLTLEGVDGSGKSTQMRLAVERLRTIGREILVSAEPGGTRIGTKIRDILLDPENRELAPVAELLLYFACRAQNVDEWIVPAVRRGAVVVSDRFTDSTLAYQGAGRGLGRDVVLALDGVACRGLKPDLTLVYDLEVEQGLERARQRHLDRMDRQSLEFHYKVREAYRELARSEPGRIRLIDAARPVEAVFEDTWREIELALGRAGVGIG